MDGLRKLSYYTAAQSAGDSFKRASPGGKAPHLQNLPRPSLPKVISVRNGNYSATPVKDTADLLRLGQQEAEPKGSAGGPALEVVVVARVEDDSLKLPRDAFETLNHNFGIDQVMLQHVYMSSYGFYYYDDHPDLAPCSGSRTQSFYFGCFLFSMVWSFNPQTMKTSAILILRTIKKYYYGSLPLEAIQSALRVYKDRISSPLSLAFVLFVIITHILDDNIYRNVRELRAIEAETDHGPSSGTFSASATQQSGIASPTAANEHGGREPVERQDTMERLEENRLEIDKLTDVAKKLADVNVHLANLLRHAKLLGLMAEALEDQSFRDTYCDRVAGDYVEDCERDTNFFLAIMPSLKRRIAAIEPSLEYLDDRAKGLHQVVFGLLTHEDAEVNLGVARANTKIASAARNDSSAMKTIALMTMLFLPGTFYAALFALPSLKFDDKAPGVVQDGFGLYWAFTIPSTLMVLLASLVMNKGWGALGRGVERVHFKWKGRGEGGEKGARVISASGSEV